MDGERIKVDDKVFDFVYIMAANDAMRRVSQAGALRKLLDCKHIKTAVRIYAESVINGVQTDFEKTVTEIKELNKDGKISGFTYGKIQKLINMTMKYLYIRYFDDDEVLGNYEQCHAPLDSIMRDFVYWSHVVLLGTEPGFDKECSWSKIEEGCTDPKYTKDNYNSFQEAVSRIIEEKQLNMNKIQFDYEFWDIAEDNRTKDKVEPFWNSYK